MHNKSVFFGFGLGMIFLSVVFLLVYRWEERANEVQLEERATEIGMVWPTDDVAEIVRRALEMGMVFENDIYDTVEYDTEESDDSAEELGEESPLHEGDDFDLMDEQDDW